MSKRASIDWSAFDGFTRPVEQRSWAGVIAWTSAFEKQLGVERSALAQKRHSSDELLFDLDHDPSARDWTWFLPLRRDREEDWSDWLAQLIEDPIAGLFAWALLREVERRQGVSYLGPVVHRGDHGHSSRVPEDVVRASPHQGCDEWPGAASPARARELDRGSF